MSRIVSRLAAIAVFLIAQAGLTSAAEVKVFSTIGVQGALEELAPKFEQASGHKLNITWATAAILVKRVQAGETADLMVLTRQGLDALTKDGKASEGASGVYVAKTLDRMGIADQMKAKTKHPPPSGNSAVLVANGEADIAIQQAPEVISVAGIDVVGPPPGDLNNITVYAAGVGAGSHQAAAANALIQFLHKPGSGRGVQSQRNHAAGCAERNI